ncbi:tail fiber protein [Staphylococcus phage LY01]|nr:tail fiber protein [Staphylococcus phage LY01]
MAENNEILITVPHKTYIPNKGMGPINKPFYVDKDILKLYDLMNIQYKRITDYDYTDINEDGKYEVKEIKSVEDYIEQKYLQVNEIFKQIKIMSNDSENINREIEDKFEKVKKNLINADSLDAYLSDLDKFKYDIEDKKLDLQTEKENVISTIEDMNNKLDSVKETLSDFENVREQFNSNYNNTMSLNDEMQNLSETANYIKSMVNDVANVEKKLNLIKDKTAELELSQESFNNSISDFENKLLDYKENLKNYMIENAEMYKGEPGKQGPKGEPFKYSDFTPEQLKELKGEPFKYSDFTSEQLEELKGESFEYSDFTQDQLELLKGEKGDKGDSVPPKVFTKEEYENLPNKDPNTLYFISEG